MADQTPKPGLYQKFEVKRIIGTDKEGEEFFVLSPTHDPVARVAIEAYADVCDKIGLSELAMDLRFGLQRVKEEGKFYPNV